LPSVYQPLDKDGITDDEQAEGRIARRRWNRRAGDTLRTTRHEPAITFRHP
jgi:hypothetical protein